MVAQTQVDLLRCEYRRLLSKSVLLPRILWHLSCPWDWKIRESFLEDGALVVDFGGRGRSWIFANREQGISTKG